jgi:diguanylate cyclase (GGDEF)-like protein
MCNAERIEEALKGMGKLPTLPGIAVKILEAVKKEHSSINEIADIISSDPPLSAEVLKTVNSPFYGLPSKITTVPRAVSMLGMNAVKNLALSFSLVKAFHNGSKNSFDYSAFWKNSLTGAVTSKLLAKNICPNAAEDAFFIGLLQNIGTLAIVQCMPRKYDLILEEMGSTQCSSYKAENEILGFDHGEIGEYLTHKWGFSEIFTVPIRYHHYPEQLNRKDNPEIELFTKFLHLASAFTDFVTLPNKTLYLGLIEHYTDKYGFSGKYDIEDIVLQLQKQTADVFPLFDIKVSQDTDYSKIIEEARTELINLSDDFLRQFIEQQRDVTKLRELAIHDGLTGLINHQQFKEVLDTELSRANRYKHPLTLIFADIDHFKRINDTYGHLAGDYALKVVAKCLKDSVRTCDVVSRYGGEEFGVILPETPLEGAVVLAERLKKALSELQMDYEGRKLSVTLSFGIAPFLQNRDITRDELIKEADDALYQAKRTGRNKYCVFVSNQRVK